MTTASRARASSAASSFRELFTPKLVTVLREGYGLAQLRADAVAGLTVAIVALPLSMAIAIASGAAPEQGLYTAIVGGFLVSLLGGSRFQIGGPAGAFIVLVAATVREHGMDGLLLATMLSGLMLAALGLLRLGAFIKFIPYPVTIGFTAGIALIIFASQLKELLGLGVATLEPGPMLEKLPWLWRALPSADGAAVAIAAATILIIVALKRWRPGWPGMLAAVALTAIAGALFDLPLATIGSRFGGLPLGLPAPALPELGLERIQAVLPNALAFTLLGAIESLLSAVVADGMTGRRHRSNCELVGQGVANLASGLFGGICVTGTIARTATNVRAGAHGPIAGMLHAAFLLLFILVAAPLASFIPLASLAGVLAVVAWNMIEKDAFASLLRASRGEAAVLMSTFLLTVFRDLTEAIVIGVALGCVVFIHRMSRSAAIESATALMEDDRPDGAEDARAPYLGFEENDPNVVVYRIRGAFFFGAAGSIGAVLDRIADRHRALIIDLADAPYVDSTAAHMIEALARKTSRRGAVIVLSGAAPDVERDLRAHGVAPPLVTYAESIEAAHRDLAAPAAR